MFCICSRMLGIWVALSTIQKYLKYVGFSPDSSGTQGHSQNGQQVDESESPCKLHKLFMPTLQLMMFHIGLVQMHIRTGWL